MIVQMKVQEMYQEITRNVQRRCKEFARNVKVMCKKFTRNMERIYPEKCQDVQGLCSEQASIVLRMCKDAQGMCKESTIKNVKGICIGARLVQKECKE